MIPSEGTWAGEAWGDFNWCPPGSFRMGFGSVDVTLSQGFWIGRHLVTQDLYRRVMGDNPSTFGGDNKLPVESMSKADAMSFARRYTEIERQSGKISDDWKFHLPTDAQWEYACRADTTTAYSFGSDATRLGDYAWFRSNSGDRTHPVGQKLPNPWGLFDMHGNCLEFVRDAYRPLAPGGVDPEVGAVDLPPRAGESSEPFALGRGGGWFFPAEGLQSAVRSRLGARDRGYQLGFRVVLVRARASLEERQRVIQDHVERYLKAFRDARYADAVAMMAPDLSAYPPYGFLQGLPGDRNEVTDIYQGLHEQGLRLRLRPRDFLVAHYGDIAVATFLSDGIWWSPAETPESVRRTSQVWRRIDGGWYLAHGHNSDYKDRT